MKRRLSNGLAGVSLLLCVGVCVLWVRSRGGYDQMLWADDRWLPDGSAASNQVELRADTRLWVTIVRGRVGPPNGQLAWGYYINADQSGGHPRLTFHHEKHDPFTLLFANAQDSTPPGWGPLRWERAIRTARRDGDDSSTIRIGVSHWLAAVVLAILPARAAWGVIGRWHRRRALARPGRCPSCGYDLRATPDRCPECGTAVNASGTTAVRAGNSTSRSRT